MFLAFLHFFHSKIEVKNRSHSSRRKTVYRRHNNEIVFLKGTLHCITIIVGRGASFFQPRLNRSNLRCSITLLCGETILLFMAAKVGN